MHTRSPRLGLTLVELLIVIVLIAIVATMALPYLLGAKVSANETAAVTTLATLVKAQVHFVNMKAADMNDNGRGEFATFGELSGQFPIRASQGGVDQLNPHYMSPAFRHVGAQGLLVRAGYCFAVFLPDDQGDGVAELPGGGAAADVDAEQSETLWCAYAWPLQYEGTGCRTFFVNQAGTILWTDDSRYSGMVRTVACGAALSPGLPIESIRGNVAVNEVGRDGNRWSVVGN